MKSTRFQLKSSNKIIIAKLIVIARHNKREHDGVRLLLRISIEIDSNRPSRSSFAIVESYTTHKSLRDRIPYIPDFQHV